MSIKALIFDLDGTAIPNSPKGMPSVRVLEAVRKAQELVKVACATGREIQIASPILDAFQFTSPCIVAGGSQIIDPISRKPIWQKILSKEKVSEIVACCSDVEYVMVAMSDTGPEKKAKDYDYIYDKPILFISSVKKSDADEIVEKLQPISGISVLPVKAWTEGDVDIHITNKEAGKRHALEEWLTIENVSKDEVMVVGDSGNDMPLFEVGGLKIAMGNGAEMLKERADWIAPSVDEDGLAVAIEKYIL